MTVAAQSPKIESAVMPMVLHIWIVSATMSETSPPIKRREMKMKAQMKAIVASVVVIALCLAAVGGVTYSWFSDSEKTTIDIDVANLELKVIVGEPTSPGVTNAEKESNGNISVTGLAAKAEVNIPYEVQHRSTIQVVYSTIVEITTTELNDYDKQNIFICEEPISDLPIVNGKYLYVLNDWTTVGDSVDFISDSTGSVTISTPITYGDEAEGGGYKLPNGSIYNEYWSPSTPGKEISIKITTKLYQGDYPYTVWESGSATVPPNGTVTGTVTYPGETNVDIPLTVEFSDINKYSENGTGVPTVVTGTKINSAITNLTQSSVTVQLTLLDISSETVSDPEFERPVTVTITVPGDLTTSGSPIVMCNGESMTVLSYSTAGSGESATTTITFQTSHFSEFLITSGQEVIQVSDFRELKEAIKKSSAYIKLIDDITYSEIATEEYIEIHNSNITLDLNGHSITNTETPFKGIFDIYDSNVTIVDSSDGKTGSVTGQSYCFETIGSGSIIIESGNYKAEKMIIQNHPQSDESGNLIGVAPTVIIYDGSFNATNSGSHAIMMIAQRISVGGGGWTIPDPAAGYLLIKGGEFKSDDSVIYSDYSRDIIIEGGNFTSNTRGSNSHAIVVGTGNLTITGGNFTASQDVLSVGSTNADSTVTITGGTFNAKVTANRDCSIIRNYNVYNGSVNVLISGGSFIMTDGTDTHSRFTAKIVGYNTSDQWTLSISGGSFNKNPESILIEPGYSAIESGGVWTIIESPIEPEP